MNIDVGGHQVALSAIGSGEPMVLIHGFGEDHRMWRRVVPALALRRRVFLYDLRGHGGSSLGQPEGSLTQLGDDLTGIIETLGFDSLPVLGFSMGGLIGARCAIDHPERVSALITTSTSPVISEGAAAWYGERARLGLAGDEALRGQLAEDTRALFQPGPDFEEGLMIRAEATRDLRGVGNACAALAALAASPVVDHLSGIRVPTLVVMGAEDHHSDASMSKRLLESIPGSQSCAIEHAGYAVPTERGSELSEAVLRWLATHAV